eukprot:758744-Hanusia_phi.AAC.3
MLLLAAEPRSSSKPRHRLSKGQARWVTCSADPNGFDQPPAAELEEDGGVEEARGQLGRVGVDAAEEVRTSRRDRLTQPAELPLELRALTLRC